MRLSSCLLKVVGGTSLALWPFIVDILHMRVTAQEFNDTKKYCPDGHGLRHATELVGKLRPTANAERLLLCVALVFETTA